MLTVQFNSTLRLGYISRLRHTSAAIERLKNPPRGGQNLSERYQRLERSLRGKEVLVKELGELAPRLASNYGEKSQSHAIKMSSSLPPKKKDVEMFHGLEVPQEPREPQSEECCMSGCAVCVYDLYEESMDAYLDAIMAFCSSLSSLKIPESKWPASIRRAQSSLSLDSLSPPDSGRQKKEVVMSAFEELERALEAKQQVNTTGEGRVDRVRR